jgi:hypothetical protein
MGDSALSLLKLRFVHGSSKALMTVSNKLILHRKVGQVSRFQRDCLA